MKKYAYNLRNISLGLLASTLIAVPAMANKSNKIVAPKLNPSLSFLGSDGTSSMFALKLENNESSKFEVSIKDATGETIFRETFEAAQFSKVFKLVNEGEANDEGLTFQVRELGTGANHNYQVVTSTNYVKDIEVSKQ